MQNSNVILGLTPKYLFSLDCFTATLPPTQADDFWDGLQVLVDPDPDSDSDENPQVFLVSGWGEPGSALAQSSDEQRRREWTCWVAAHRLKTRTGSDNDNDVQRLIVVEFELEQDIFNPLYPIASSSTASESLTPGTSTTATSSSAETTRTSHRGSTPNPVPASTSSDESTSRDDATGQAAAAGSGDGAQLSVGQLVLGASLDGDAIWVPSAEAILESTTSRTKPLRALERMRRLGRSEGPKNVGTMDMFTVLSQVNEQLSRALDLTQLLETVVGIIKDLTQFHRVLVYQFDEAWNGQVRSSLEEGKKTSRRRRRRRRGLMLLFYFI